MIAAASSLDTPGYLTKTVRDAAKLYTITAGNDPHDATSLTEEVKVDDSIWERTDLKGVKIGIPKEYYIEGIEPGVRGAIMNAIEALKKL